MSYVVKINKGELTILRDSAAQLKAARENVEKYQRIVEELRQNDEAWRKRYRRCCESADAARADVGKLQTELADAACSRARLRLDLDNLQDLLIEAGFADQSGPKMTSAVMVKILPDVAKYRTRKLARMGTATDPEPDDKAVTAYTIRVREDKSLEYIVPGDKGGAGTDDKRSVIRAFLHLPVWRRYEAMVIVGLMSTDAPIPKATDPEWAVMFRQATAEQLAKIKQLCDCDETADELRERLTEAYGCVPALLGTATCLTATARCELREPGERRVCGQCELWERDVGNPYRGTAKCTGTSTDAEPCSWRSGEAFECVCKNEFRQRVGRKSDEN